jgi:hypothetical protein
VGKRDVAKRKRKRKRCQELFQRVYDEFEGGQMTVEQNKAVAKRLFEELLDNENVGILNDLFTEDCVIHRGDLAEPAQEYLRLLREYFGLEIAGTFIK